MTQNSYLFNAPATNCIYTQQCVKKVVFVSRGLMEFAIGLVNSVTNLLTNGQVKFFEEFKSQKNCEVNLLIKKFLRLVEN